MNKEDSPGVKKRKMFKNEAWQVYEVYGYYVDGTSQCKVC